VRFFFALVTTAGGLGRLPSRLRLDLDTGMSTMIVA
jgi:hypothetical protein